MSGVLKELLAKTSPVKWILGRINRLEKALQEEKKSRENCIEQTLAMIGSLEEKHKAELSRLEKLLKDEASKRALHVKELKDENSRIREKMQYWHHKDLRPDQYAEALKEWYAERTGEILDLEHPQTYNEKMQWMKLYDATPIKTRLTDKYLVREWVAEKIGGGILNSFARSL